MTTPDIKAYEDKINSQLQQAKASLVEFEAKVKEKASPAEMEVINRLKSKHHEIDKKRQELKSTGEANPQIKAEIDADVAKLKTSLADLATKLKKAV